MSSSNIQSLETQLVLADRLFGNQGLNTLVKLVRIEGNLNSKKLEESVKAVECQDPLWRSTLVLGSDGNAEIRVADGPRSTAFEIVDQPLGGLHVLEALTETKRKTLSASDQPWKVVLVRHTDQSWTLMAAGHASLFGEHQLSTFARQISEFYKAGTLTPADNAQTEKVTPPGEPARWITELESVGPKLDFPRLPVLTPVMEVSTATLPDLTLAGGPVLSGTRWLDLAAGVSYVLGTYSNQTDFAVGLPFPTGARTNVLPLRFKIPQTGTFRSLAVGFADQYHRWAPQAGVPLGALVEGLGHPRDLPLNPVFQAAFDVEEPFEPSFEGCTCRPLAAPISAQTVDLLVQIRASGLRIGYSRQRIDSPVAQTLGRSLETFLNQALADPDRQLSELDILAPQDRELYVDRVNKTGWQEFLEVGLGSLVFHHFTASREKAALVFQGVTYTYGELAEKVDSLAQALVAAPGGVPELVGISLPRSVEMVAAVLAVLKIGKTYVPLDPGFPLERLGHMVSHSGLSLVVTKPEFHGRFPGKDLRFLDPAQVVGAPSLTTAEPHSDTPAYIIYTSGSTGVPKGVSVPRGALANFLQSMVQVPGIGPEDRLAAVTTLSFDIAGLELLGPLCVGGTVVLATENEALDPVLLAKLLQDQKVTILQATPMTWQFLVASGWSGAPDLKALCGGEALSPKLAQALGPRVRELWNMYGPTETTVWSTCGRITDFDAPVTVGKPIANTTVYVLDPQGRPVPPGVEGQLFIGGAGVALGYHRAPDLTAGKFTADPFRPGDRRYDTGDRARFDFQRNLQIVGRSDFQVKVRGYRIELGEIETCLARFPGITQAVAGVDPTEAQTSELAVCYVLSPGTGVPEPAALRQHCLQALPSYMVPSHFIRVEAFPQTPNGKVDRKMLFRQVFGSLAPGPAPAASEGPKARPKDGSEQALSEIWKRHLGGTSPGIHDNFFELGGTSLTALTVSLDVAKELSPGFSVLKIFEFPTIASLAAHLDGMKKESSFIQQAKTRAARRRKQSPSPTAFDVAVIGAAGRFPGAANLDELWSILRESRNTVTFFDRSDLDPLVSDRERNDPAYIPARGVLEGIDLFDGNFFGIPPNEAELMDPQQRVFLEVCWEAFENAGYVGEAIDGSVGVWAAKGNDFYYVYNVLTRPDKLAIMGEIAAEIANEKDHIAPRVSHKLNLTGPSLSVHSACSSTLVVVENAYQALVTYQVDVALAGGVDIKTPQKSGQRYEEGGIFSDDGTCRPFDASAKGTMFGEGAGAVVLKRLDDALADNDQILAVIKGAAVNHDGGEKVSYLAPSIEGQARVIASALALGDVDPRTVSYIEAHGTATPMGDPIEVEALTRVFRAYTDRNGFCALGSIKGNFGHATTAAGIAGLLKVVLAMKYRKIPATVNYENPNPRIDFENSPFFVADRLTDWKTDPGVPMRAGVSSFGFCGTNAHVVLEEPPVRPALAAAPARPWQLFLLSAKHPLALGSLGQGYAGHLGSLTPGAFADAAYTTHVGRKRFDHRRAVVARSPEEAETVLAQNTGPQIYNIQTQAEDPPVAFLFPGQGSQYINMGSSLYRSEPVFKASVDHCCEILKPHLGCDLRDFLFPDPADSAKATQSLNNTFFTQPAIYTISYSLARLLEDWGTVPKAFVGHSIGEFVAATLAGVMAVEDALKLVAARGRLMADLPGGSMLSVRISEAEVRSRLPAGIDMAAVNSPKLSVVAGPTGLVDRFAESLEAEGIASRKLHTSHAFHSSMMDPVVGEFRKVVESVTLSAPKIPFVSTVTGEWISPEVATDPGYWAQHLRAPVLFSKAVSVLLADPKMVLVECGPRRTSATLALQHQPQNPGRVVATMPDSAEPGDEYPSLLLALGTLWAQGQTVDWKAFHRDEIRRRRPLPTYPFQRRRYWIEPGDTTSFGLTAQIFQPKGVPSAAPEPDQGPAPAASQGRTPAMAALVGILEDSLGEQLGAFNEEARFIELGLDSLLITQLARTVRQKLGFEVTFRQLSENLNTPRALAEAIQAAQGISQASAPSKVQAPAPGTPVSSPEMKGARLGKDELGRPAWYVPDPARPGKYIKVETRNE